MGTEMMRSGLLALVLAAMPAWAQAPFFWVHASDPQFGMYTANKDFTQETANWEFVIANVNRLKPAFLVVTGDLTNKDRDEAQITEYKRINKMLNPAVHLYNVPGNHDLGNEPTSETLAAYRKTYGPDYYSFREGQVYGIVLNSSLFKAPVNVPAEAAKQEKWLEEELKKAQASGAVPIVFQHIPYFLENPDEPEVYSTLPIDTRKRVLSLLKRYGVHYVFAGHHHRNAFGKDGDLDMVTSSAAGMPFGPEGSGIRIEELKGRNVEHRFYPLSLIPNIYPVPPAKL